jgi:hypothetical protein
MHSNLLLQMSPHLLRPHPLRLLSARQVRKSTRLLLMASNMLRKLLKVGQFLKSLLFQLRPLRRHRLQRQLLVVHPCQPHWLGI